MKSRLYIICALSVYFCSTIYSQNYFEIFRNCTPTTNPPCMFNSSGNCHGFAWYWAEDVSKTFIPNVGLILTPINDGGVTRYKLKSRERIYNKVSSPTYPGIVVYNNGGHSAITTSVGAGGNIFYYISNNWCQPRPGVLAIHESDDKTCYNYSQTYYQLYREKILNSTIKKTTWPIAVTLPNPYIINKVLSKLELENVTIQTNVDFNVDEITITGTFEVIQGIDLKIY